jgi:dethiobiotin synthetase
MTILAVTGTGTEIGKTVVTAAVAALALDAGRTVAVVKPAQTGVGTDEPGDVAEVVRLAGTVTGRELARYPDPLAPDLAAARCGRPPVRVADVAAVVTMLAAAHDLVLVEGAGGLLVRYDAAGTTFADLAAACGAEPLLVTHAGLGTLNWTALTAEAMRRRGLRCRGLVVGCWPAAPDLATRTNLGALPAVAGLPLLGVLPAGMSTMDRAEFLATARNALHPALGGCAPSPARPAGYRA